MTVRIFVNRPYIIVENGQPKVVARHLEELTQGYRSVSVCFFTVSHFVFVFLFVILMTSSLPLQSETSGSGVFTSVVVVSASVVVCISMDAVLKDQPQFNVKCQKHL